MNWRSYLLLGLLGFCIPVILTLIQHSPGYMDADYYYAGGLRLAEGFGFSEEILWNFLDDPSGLPHPSHGYWMPLPSIIAAVGLVLFRNGGFPAARLLFILLAAGLPVLTAALAYRLHRRKGLALFSGGLALLPTFYAPYLATTDSFVPCMLIGGLFFLILPVGLNNSTTYKGVSQGTAIGLGFLSGIMQLSRPDGAIWLLAAFVAILISGAGGGWLHELGKRFRLWIICLIGFLIPVGPWFLRNMNVFGSPLSPAGSRPLWILEYNELFIIPASTLTFQRWLEQGWHVIVKARAFAFGQNLQTAIAVQGGVILAPLILVGVWHLRSEKRIQLLGLTWLATFFVMTMIFPFQGWRGGFFHSGAGFQPLFWALAPVGLDVCLMWGKNHRGWNIRQAWIVLGSGLLVIMAIITLVVTTNRIFSEMSVNGWDDDWPRYRAVEKILFSVGAKSEDRVMANNAPGYFSATGRSAISIPFADIRVICDAATRYQVRYLVLEIDQIPGETEMFHKPANRQCWHFLKSHDNVRLFEKFP